MWLVAAGTYVGFQCTCHRTALIISALLTVSLCWKGAFYEAPVLLTDFGDLLHEYCRIVGLETTRSSESMAHDCHVRALSQPVCLKHMPCSATATPSVSL